MPKVFAQGDILFELVEPTPIAGNVLQDADEGEVVVAEGEMTGHMHRLVGNVTFYRDDALARDVPGNLYVGHVRVEGAVALLEHDEHATILIEPGHYRVRRQRQLDPSDFDMFGD